MKILAKIFTACGAYPVRRHSRDISAARTTFELLEKGEAVGIFPQGTRAKGKGTAVKAKHGVAKFAFEANVPVQPVAIWGKIRLFGKVNVFYCIYHPYLGFCVIVMEFLITAFTPVTVT